MATKACFACSKMAASSSSALISLESHWPGNFHGVRSGCDFLWLFQHSSSASSGLLTSDSACTSPVSCSAICTNWNCNSAGLAWWPASSPSQMLFCQWPLNQDTTVGFKFATELNSCIFKLHRSLTHPWTLYPCLWSCYLQNAKMVSPSSLQKLETLMLLSAQILPNCQ